MIARSRVVSGSRVLGIHQLERGHDRRERIAQLVAEHREELVLRAIRTHLIGDVDRDDHHAVDDAGLVEQRLEVEAEVAILEGSGPVPIERHAHLAHRERLAGPIHPVEDAG